MDIITAISPKRLTKDTPFDNYILTEYAYSNLPNFIEWKYHDWESYGQAKCVAGKVFKGRQI